jgi:hypothetical protein
MPVLFNIKNPREVQVRYQWSGESPLFIGRAATNPICIPDPLVSWIHAEVRFEDGHYVLRDLGSANGTYYDGRFVTSPVSLKPGGKLYVGDTEIEVQDVLERDKAAPARRTGWDVWSQTATSGVVAQAESRGNNLLLALTEIDGDTDWLVPVLFQRAAEHYQAFGLLREAAACWIEAGNKDDAIDIYLKTYEYSKAAPLLMEQGRYAEALSCYRSWIANLKKNDPLSRINALLGVALSLNLLKSEPDDANAAWREARSLAEAPKANPLLAGACWEALGAFGARIGRNDLVQVGF